jgi:hypothetical protein
VNVVLGLLSVAVSYLVRGPFQSQNGQARCFRDDFLLQILLEGDPGEVTFESEFHVDAEHAFVC